jgi:hypothetical protein
MDDAEFAELCAKGRGILFEIMQEADKRAKKTEAKKHAADIQVQGQGLNL